MPRSLAKKQPSVKVRPDLPGPALPSSQAGPSLPSQAATDEFDDYDDEFWTSEANQYAMDTLESSVPLQTAVVTTEKPQNPIDSAKLKLAGTTGETALPLSDSGDSDGESEGVEARDTRRKTLKLQIARLRQELDRAERDLAAVES